MGPAWDLMGPAWDLMGPPWDTHGASMGHPWGLHGAYSRRPAFQSSIKNVKLLVMVSLKLSRERVYIVFYTESEFHSLRV